MTPKGGKLHKFLGMKLDFLGDGEVSIKMPEMIGDMIKNFKELLDKMKSLESPVAPHLFHVYKGVMNILVELSKRFYNMVTYGLFFSKRVRSNIYTAVEFSKIHVKETYLD